jgi:hypothetical protein
MARADIAETSPDKAIQLLEEQGLLLRMRKVARLDRAGLTTEQIAVELAKSDPTWTHELVLALVGKSGTPVQRTLLSEQYGRVSEDVAQGDLIEPESDIKELLSYAMKVITDYIKAAPKNACPECKALPKDAVDAAFKVLKAGGLGLGENVSIVEVHMDADTRDVLRQVMAYTKPASRLGPMIEVEFTGVEA